MKRQKVSEMSSNGNTEGGTTSAAATAKAKNPLVLVFTKTYEWRFYYASQGAVSTSVKFPVEASLGLPSMTLKLSLHKELSHSQEKLRLSYDCQANDGEVCPKYEARVSGKYEDSPETTVLESEMKKTGGSSVFRLRPFHSAWIKFEITLQFYGKRNVAAVNRDIGAINFSGDTWNEQHQPSLIVELLESGLNSDVKIISSEGQEFNAHKLILTGKNEVFDAMFRHNMKESTTGVVKLDDMSARAVKFLLHFIYSTQILKISTKEKDTDGTDATISEVLYLVDKFGLTELKNYLDENFGKFCDKDNFWSLFQLCKLHSLDKGQAAVYEFMKDKNSDFVRAVLFSLA